MKWLSSVALALLLTCAPTSSANAEEPIVVSGVVQIGTPGVPLDKNQLSLKFNILEGIVSISEQSVQIGDGGTFSLTGISLDPARTYVLSAQYKVVTYSKSFTYSDLTDSLVITVYDTNGSSEIIEFESYTVIVTGADPSKKLIEVLERASVRNNSQTTFSPEFQSDSGGMPDLLRFALPQGAENLDVRSSLIGGQILEVDRGFAINTPVPPTAGEPHYIEFIYRIKYTGDNINLGRTMRFGSEYLRFVVPQSTGTGKSLHMNSLGSTQIGGREFQLLEAEKIPAGFKLDLFVEGLPQPTFVNKITLLANEVYLVYILPGVLILMLVLSIFKSRSLKPLSDSSPSETAASLAKRLKDLESNKGNLSESQYAHERSVIKEELLASKLYWKILRDRKD